MSIFTHCKYKVYFTINSTRNKNIGSIYFRTCFLWSGKNSCQYGITPAFTRCRRRKFFKISDMRTNILAEFIFAAVFSAAKKISADKVKKAPALHPLPRPGSFYG